MKGLIGSLIVFAGVAILVVAIWLFVMIWIFHPGRL